jgi:hypothetical protein
VRDFWFNWWHVVAITTAMAHFSWIRYHYKFTYDKDREEEEVERGLFNDPELQINSVIVPYISPVIDKLAT